MRSCFEPMCVRLNVKLKRAYEALAKSHGHSILVNRISPRGVTNAELRIEDWVNGVVPNTGSGSSTSGPMRSNLFWRRIAREP